MQLVDSIPVSWKSEIRKSDNNPKDLSDSKYTLYIHHATTVEILQLTCKGFYEKFINQIQTKPTSQLYWERMIIEGLGEILDWKQIYMIPRVATIESAYFCEGCVIQKWDKLLISFCHWTLLYKIKESLYLYHAQEVYIGNLLPSSL